MNSSADDQLNADLIQENNLLKRKIEAAEQSTEQTAKQLRHRDREVESARKRISKLSSALRKVLGNVTNVQPGDETVNQSVIGITDDSTFVNTTSFRDYEADLVEEIEQLLGYVDEVESRVEFAKVERGIKDGNEVNRRVVLEKVVASKEQELEQVKKNIGRQKAEQEEMQVRIDELQADKERVQGEVQKALEESQLAKYDNISLQKQMHSMRGDFDAAEKTREKAAKERLALLGTIEWLEGSRLNVDAQLAKYRAEVESASEAKEAMQQQISELQDNLRLSEANRQPETAQREELVSQVEKHESEKKDLELRCQSALDTISGLEKQCQEADTKAADMSLELHDLQVCFEEEKRASSQLRVDLLAQSLDALRLESVQWNSLIVELRNDLVQSQSLLKSSKATWSEEADRYSTRLAALEDELMKASNALQEKSADVDRLQLDLQASRTNQQLAEDALKQLVPNRESDLTVTEDVSVVGFLRDEVVKRQEALQERIGGLEAAVEALEEAKRVLEREKTTLEEENGDLVEEKRDLAGRIEFLESEKSVLEGEKRILQEEKGGLEDQIAVLQEETRTHFLASEAATEELREAREGFEALKEQMEGRNAEYWEVKEELAEWQERYERSQADVKIKEDLEERLEEAVTEMEKAREEAEERLARCVSLEEGANLVQKQMEQSRSRLELLEEELEKSKAEGDKFAEVEQQLTVATSLIEQLEQDLAQKAQECEDADDKELALRKDNKKLAARIATLQGKIEKLQLQVSTSRPPVQGSKTPIVAISRAVENGRSAIVPLPAPSSASRKRRAPEDEEQADAMSGQQTTTTTTRAIFAPKSTTSETINVKKAVPLLTPGTRPANGSLATMKPPSVQSLTEKKSFCSPSEALARQYKTSSKGLNSTTLQERTNQSLPRTQEGVTLDNPFMAKLKGYHRPTATPILSVTQEAGPTS